MEDNGKKYLRRYIIAFSFFGVLLFMGITYAILQRNLKIEGVTNINKNTWSVYFDNISVIEGSATAKVPATVDNSGMAINFTVDLEYPGDSYEFYVDVINNGSIDAVVNNVYFTSLSAEQKKYIDYFVTYDDGTAIELGDALHANTQDKIKIVAKYNDYAMSTSDEPLSLSASIQYAQDDGKGVTRTKNVLYNLLKGQSKGSDLGQVNLGQTSIDNQTNGVYLLNTTSSYTNPIYYYRGAVNNNVIFNNYCWKMIRTTDTGGVKLIYNGKSKNGKCENIGVDSFIEDDTAVPKKYTGKHRWSDNHFSSDDVIYRSSEMKTVLESWYADHMTNVTSKLEDIPFHNETTYTTGGTGIKGYFPAFYRIWKDNSNNAVNVPKTSIVLGNSVYGDEFTYTLGATNVNNRLTYPVGLIESDEAVLAGGKGWISNSDPSVNRQYYLYNSKSNDDEGVYWTLSPCRVGNDSVPYILVVYSYGHIGYFYVHATDAGVRPVVSLKSGTTYQNGGDGTTSNPYVIS